MSEYQIINAFKHLGYGIAWAGFWIGLGLFNFQGQGCSETSSSGKIFQEHIINK